MGSCGVGLVGWGGGRTDTWCVVLAFYVRELSGSALGGVWGGGYGGGVRGRGGGNNIICVLLYCLGSQLDG